MKSTNGSKSGTSSKGKNLKSSSTSVKPKGSKGTKSTESSGKEKGGTRNKFR